MNATIIAMLCALIVSCTQEQRSNLSATTFEQIEVVKDTNRNIVMTKSGIADSNNFRTFKYYDTTGRLVFVIEWGGLDHNRKLSSPQLIDTGINGILAGSYFYNEYLSNLFGPVNNFQAYLDSHAVDSHGKHFKITDSIIYKNYNFHLMQNEFENLKKYLE